MRIEDSDEITELETIPQQVQQRDEGLKEWLELRQEKLLSVVRSPQGALDNLTREAGQSANVNATLVQEGLAISTYADHDWSGRAGIAFKSTTSLLLGFFPSDIGSAGFRGFNSDGSITPKVMLELEKWRRSRPVVGHSMRRTNNSAVQKAGESLERRLDFKSDHATTQYYDTKGGYVYTGHKNKFSNKHANFTVRGHKVPKNRIRHNETHIRCNLADIEGVFITLKDWKRNSPLALKSLNILIETINERRSRFEEYLPQIKKSIKDKLQYYQEAIELLSEKKLRYEKDLELLEKGVGINNSDLDSAFSRKKQKCPSFDKRNIENKKIWLRKHIAQITLDHQELVIAHGYIEENNQDCKIIKNLQEELKIYLYNADKGLCSEVSQGDAVEKLEKFKCLSLSSTFEKGRKDVCNNPRTIIFAGFLVAQGFSFNQLRKAAFKGFAGEAGSYPLAIITASLSAEWFANSIVYLYKDVRQALYARSISDIAGVSMIAASVCGGYYLINKELERGGDFSEINSSTMAAQYAVMGTAAIRLTPLLLGRGANLCRTTAGHIIRMSENIKAICCSTNESQASQGGLELGDLEMQTIPENLSQDSIGAPLANRAAVNGVK